MNSKKPPAFILAALLWCLALLAVVVVGTLHAAHIDLRVGKNHGDLIQAHYIAVAGVETAKALLYHDAMERRNAGFNHTGDLFNAPGHFRDVPLGRGHFRVVRPGGFDEGGGSVFGVADEESRINVNTASVETLDEIEGIDQEIAASLLAYRDQVNNFRTLRELLLVPTVPPSLLFGHSAPPAPGLSDEPPAEQGLAAVLTVYSSVRNLNASGQERIDVQNADESSLQTVPGITSEIAKAIVSHRGENRIENLVDLLEVRAEQTEGNANESDANNGNASENDSGPALINEELLIGIADDLTVDTEPEQNGLINLNTASASVLACLPGLDPDLAYAIVSHRESNGFFTNVAELLRVPNMNAELLKPLFPLLTARSETYRIMSEGKVESTGARKRIHIVVRVGASRLDTLFYKEET